LLDPPILHGIIREPNVPFDSCGFCQLQQAYHKLVKEFQAHQDVVAKENEEKRTIARGRRGTSLTRLTTSTKICYKEWVRSRLTPSFKGMRLPPKL
jgi:hypothetical protein